MRDTKGFCWDPGAGNFNFKATQKLCTFETITDTFCRVRGTLSRSVKTSAFGKPESDKCKLVQHLFLWGAPAAEKKCVHFAQDVTTNPVTFLMISTALYPRNLEVPHKVQQILGGSGGGKAEGGNPQTWKVHNTLQSPKVLGGGEVGVVRRENLCSP